MADAEIEAVRDQLYAFADVVLDLFEATARESRTAFAALDADASDEAAERAAIMEFEGSRPRILAAHAAFTSRRRSSAPH